MSQDLNAEGNRYFQQGRYSEALECYRRALELDRRSGNPRELTATLGNMANLHAATGRHEDALRYYREVLDISKDESFPKIIWKRYQTFIYNLLQFFCFQPMVRIFPFI